VGNRLKIYRLLFKREKTMKAIVAVDLNWGIGFRGNLLEKIPDDLLFFKQTTIGKIVIMGRETFESLPGKKPLKDRINIVLSTKEHFRDNQITICHSLSELAHELKKYPTDDVFIIGGEKIYNQLLPYCTEVYVTKIKNEYPADKFFKNLDQDQAWNLESTSNYKNYNNLTYSFTKYKNLKLTDFNIA